MFNRSVNKVILIGNLGKDVELKHTESVSIAEISIATTESIRNKQSGVYEQCTEWHKVVAFGKRADAIAKFTNKGKKVYIEGKLQTKSWQDTQGNNRSSTEIILQDIQLLDSSKNIPSAPLIESTQQPTQPAQPAQPAQPTQPTQLTQPAQDVTRYQKAKPEPSKKQIATPQCPAT